VLEDGETAILPLTAFSVEKPLPVHVVAFSLDHTRVLDPPSAIGFGFAESVAVTAESTVMKTLARSEVPPSALQDSR
jgi:hypothetical protein